MSKKPKILIVEDKRIIAREMQYKLESLGYDVPANVSSGEEAIKKAEELSPDLVLMDIILHGEMDGVEAADQIRTCFNIPVVYVTANVSDARLEDIKRTEPFGCLFKPFDDMELHAAIEMALYKHQMQSKLRENEERFRTMYKSSGVGIARISPDFSIEHANDTYCRMLGYTEEEIIGKTLQDITYSEDIPENIEKQKKLGLGEIDFFKMEKRFIHKDGHIVWGLLNANLIRDDKGKPWYFLGNVVDITDRKRAEEALKESEERFRTIFESSEEGYYEIDLAGRFTFFNETMRKISGHSAGELMGTSNLEYTTPETAKKMYKLFNEIYKTGKPGEIGEYEGTAKDGTKITLGLSAYLMRDEKGEPVGFRGIVRDVTKRKEMEYELERRFQYLEGVLEAAPYAVIALDRNHQVVRWNPGAEKLFGYSQEEVIGRELDSLVATTADAMEEANRATKATMSGKTLSPWEAVRFRKDGSSVNVTVGGSSIMVDGELIGAVVIYDDITARKEAEEEIKSYQEHLALINQILRHDLTNDLVVIRSALNLYNKSPEEEFLQEISSHTEKSLDLMKRMRGLESFMSRHRELQICEMRDSIDEVIKNYPFIDFKVKGKAQVMADDSLSSVIDNIIRNAVIHGKADTIAITIGEATGMCEVRIADNGSGIADDIKEKVFEEGFTHGDTAHTGLGLHIVDKAMKSYGGHVYTESNEPKGAIFVLRFRMVK